MPKYYKREMPDLNGTGEKQYYYEMRSEGAIDTIALVKRMRQRYRILDEGALLGVMDAMIRTMAEVLADGYTISLDGMGNFSLALGLEDYESSTPEQRRGGEPNARRVIVRDVRFKAQRKWIHDIDYRCLHRLHRDVSGTRDLRRPTTTREERIAIALDFIRKHGYLRLMNYVELSGLSRTTASRELSDFSHDRSVPIKSEGRGPSRIWVEDNTHKA